MKIFITDGSPEGFFTAVFDAFNQKDANITSDTHVQLALDREVIRVIPDAGKSGRVLRGIYNCDRYAAEEISLVLRSCDPLKEQIVFEYIKKLMQIKFPIRKRLSLSEVIRFNEISYKVTGETHRLKGLLRFMECAGGVLYAPYSPDNDITEILALHFAARFSGKQFVIHDVKRKIAAMFDGEEIVMTGAGDAEIYLSEYESYFQNLWKQYYNSVNIASRPHPKQMRGSMPVRYWKFLPEKK